MADIAARLLTPAVAPTPRPVEVAPMPRERVIGDARGG